MNFTNLKVSSRLAIGFGALLILMAAIVIDAIISMRIIKTDLDKVINENLYKMSLVQDMSESVHIVSRVTRTLILLQDEAEIKAEEAKILAARAKYNTSVELLEKTEAEADGKVIRAAMREARLAARPLTDRVIELAKMNRDAEALEVLMKEAGPATQKWQDALDANIALQKKHNEEDASDANESYKQGFATLIVLSAFSLLIGIAGAIVITRSLLKQLGGEPGTANAIASSIAAGDLTVSIPVKANDRSSVMFAMKEMRDSLVKIVGEVRSGTDTIATASSQIASGNMDLSSRTEQQASSLEETASSMEELTSTVKQNADNARQANQLAVSASSVAVKGGDVVAQVVTTMDSINDSAKKIVDIIGVIDGIAFQTNILALNAAVEAARAGEQGRGFAVVASEVRNLAQRSAAAAKEIKTLISDSVEKVDAGSKLVGVAGSTMEEIVDSVKRVTDVMAEIMAASQEQSAGIEQVNQAVSQMDQVTQQNAALVEEAAAAAESLQEQAGALTRVVSVFKLDGMHHSSMSAAPAAATRAPVVKQMTATRNSQPRRALAKPAQQAPRTERLTASQKAAAPAAGDDWESF